MNIWESTVLTDKGVALQAKLVDGQTLHITRVMTGGAKVPVVNLRQQTSVTDGGSEITLQPVRIEGDQMILPVLLENRGLEEGYDLWQVGIYAQDPDEGEILYCIAQASKAKHVPSQTEGPGFSITWDFCFKTSNTAPFDVNLNSVGLISIEQYQVHTGEINGLKSSVVNLDHRIEELNAELDKKANQIDVESVGTKIKTVNNTFGYGSFSDGYVQIGKTVCVSFRVSLVTNIAAGRVLCSGLPKPLSDLAILNVYDSVASTYSRAKVTYDGAVYVETAHNSGTSLIANGSYIAK